jgi:hypothetical protein
MNVLLLHARQPLLVDLLARARLLVEGRPIGAHHHVEDLGIEDEAKLLVASGEK